MARCRPWMLGCCLLAAALVCAVAFVCLWISAQEEPGCSSSSSGSFRRAAVAADSKLCSDIGRSMLQYGGSAADGAIAALLCTSVVNPQSMGIGGGSIVTVRDKTGAVKVFNFREKAPRSVRAELLKDCSPTVGLSTGGQWIGVPGELRGYEAIHKEYGKLPWAKLFEPTIALARGGVNISVYLDALLSKSLVKNLVEQSPLCSQQILCKGKTVLGRGDVLKFPKLAETLEAVAEHGADVFYAGKIGRDFIQDVQAAGGTMDMEDLKSFQVHVGDAWTVPLGDFRMHLPPPPAGGALLGFILKVMKEFSLTPNSLHGDQRIQMYHRYIEALKFANGQKRRIRDPLLNDISADHLVDASFVNRIVRMISPNGTHDAPYYNVTPSADHTGTTHVSVVDGDGLAVSATSTINQIFGGAMYSPQTGIILNNELADFCGRADTVKPGEQPPSSMTPMILESKSGELLVIGGSGGSLIPTAVALSIINHLWLGMNLEDAIAAPIVFVDSKNNVNFEKRFDESVKNGLRGFGHTFGDWKFFLNVVNAIKKEKDCIVAVSDKRKMGVASGY